jgi:glyoxylate reductase
MSPVIGTSHRFAAMQRLIGYRRQSGLSQVIPADVFMSDALDELIPLQATYWESLDQMLARMDIISINCPHTPATYHLLSARRLKQLRPQAYVVNTARGEVIDKNALIRMIEAGELAGAGLDVFEHEPAVNPKLARLARDGKVVLLPHMGSATVEGRIDMGEKVIVNIRTFMDGHKPPDRVLPSML